MGDFNKMFARANFMNAVAAGGNALQAGFTLGYLTAGLASNAARSAPTLWQEAGRDMTVSARGFLRARGHSTFYYTMNRAAAIRTEGAAMEGAGMAAFETGKEITGKIGETWSPLVSINPAQGAAELINDMGAEMSRGTYDYVRDAQDLLGGLQDQFQRKGCK